MHDPALIPEINSSTKWHVLYLLCSLGWYHRFVDKAPVMLHSDLAYRAGTHPNTQAHTKHSCRLIRRFFSVLHIITHFGKHTITTLTHATKQQLCALHEPEASSNTY